MSPWELRGAVVVGDIFLQGEHLAWPVLKRHGCLAQAVERAMAVTMFDASIALHDRQRPFCRSSWRRCGPSGCRRTDIRATSMPGRSVHTPGIQAASTPACCRPAAWRSAPALANVYGRLNTSGSTGHRRSGRQRGAEQLRVTHSATPGACSADLLGGHNRKRP